jgi:hypothetical protein
LRRQIGEEMGECIYRVQNTVEVKNKKDLEEDVRGIIKEEAKENIN